MRLWKSLRSFCIWLVEVVDETLAQTLEMVRKWRGVGCDSKGLSDTVPRHNFPPQPRAHLVATNTNLKIRRTIGSHVFGSGIRQTADQKGTGR